MNSTELELLKVQHVIRSVVFKVAGHSLDKNDLQDILQEVNLRVLSGGYDPARGTMAAWVSYIAHNKAIDALRRWSRRAKPASDAMDQATEGGAGDEDALANSNGIGDIEMADPHTEDILQALTRERMTGKIESVIGQLASDDLHFLLISLKSDFSYEDYAKDLGTSDVALRVRKHRLVEKLRLMLAGLNS